MFTSNLGKKVFSIVLTRLDNLNRGRKQSSPLPASIYIWLPILLAGDGLQRIQ